MGKGSYGLPVEKSASSTTYDKAFRMEAVRPEQKSNNHLLKPFGTPVHLHFVHLILGYPPFEEHEEKTVNKEDYRIDDPCDGTHVHSSASMINTYL